MGAVIGGRYEVIKLLGSGAADRAFTVKGVTLSAQARAKIEAAGGTVEA